MRMSDWSSDLCSYDLVEYKNLLQRYHALCARLGPLPEPRVLNIDHGAQRYVLFEFDGEPAKADAPCTTPAMAWIDAPVSGASVGWSFKVAGWAFKDGAGLSGVEVLLDGKPVAKAEYGLSSPGPAVYGKSSTDPTHPDVRAGERRVGKEGVGRWRDRWWA